MSGEICELVSSLVETSYSDSVQFSKIVQACLELGSFHNQDKVEVIIKNINNSLNSSFDKEKGLILLQSLLSQISVEAFSSNAFSWMVSCNKIISQKEGVNSVLALRVLSNLIKLSVKFPEVNKEVAKQIVPKFLQDHVRRKSTLQTSVELLECVRSCMQEYPGPAGEFRLDIQQLLLLTVEGGEEVVRAASKCVPLVAGAGGGGKQGVAHKTAWRRLQMGLVRVLHTLLNQLYEHVGCQTEEITVTEEDVGLTLETIKERNILIKSQRLVTQFTSVALFLQTMLLEKFPVAKAVAPDAILDVVSHAQKPTLATLGSSREAAAVVAVLPTVQVAALRLLESLVLCLGRNLVPHGGMVCYLCSQVVHWTYQKHGDWPYAMEKPFSQTRLAAYCCLYSWITVSGAASQLETVLDKLLPAMLADINAEKPSVRLRVGSKAGKGKKKQQVLVNQEDRSEKLGDSVANSRLCERALLTVLALLRVSATRVKPDVVSDVTSVVLRVVADLPVPYSDANCLTALYQLLLVLCLEPHPRLAPPLPSALAAFTAGSHHPVAKIRTTCTAALSCLDKIIHPTSATLYFPMALNNQPYEKEIEDKDDEEDENSMPALKRMRVDSPFKPQSIGSVELDQSGVDRETSKEQLSEKKQVEVIDCVDSSDSEEVVELVPIENGEEESKAGESDDEEIDVVDITEEDEKKIEEQSSENSNNKLTEEKSFSSLEAKENEAEVKENEAEVKENEAEVKENEAESKCLEENTKSENSFKSAETDDSKLLEPVKHDGCEEDADVSQMLMDFTDEVNENTEK